jgi:hypothetical protein
METLLLMALAVPLVTAAAVFARRRSSAAWRDSAGVLGLSMVRDAKGRVVLEGCVGSARVEVDAVEHVRDRKVTSWTRVRASGDIPVGLLVGGEGFWRRWNEEHGQDSVERAGVAFDDHVIARGEVPEIFALLNGDTRAQFRELEKIYRAFVSQGTVHLEQQGLIREPETLTRLVRGVARLAMALSLQGPSLADRLGANVVTDGNGLVRLRNLEVLLDRYPGTASAQLACQHAMGDRSYEVSTLAACHSGPEGFPTLERVVDDTKAPLALRLRSVRHLAEHLAPDHALEFLIELVERGDSLKTAAVVELAAMGFDPEVEVLLDLLSDGQAEGWIAFATAVTALGRDDLTGPLEALLDEDAAGDSLEFTLGAVPRTDASVEGAPDAPDNVDDSEEARLIVVEIPPDLRTDIDVQQAAREALEALRVYPVEPPANAEDEEEELETEGADDIERPDDDLDEATHGVDDDDEEPASTEHGDDDGSEAEFEANGE